jgi:hypothetical protein
VDFTQPASEVFALPFADSIRPSEWKAQRSNDSHKPSPLCRNHSQKAIVASDDSFEWPHFLRAPLLGSENHSTLINPFHPMMLEELSVVSGGDSATSKPIQKLHLCAAALSADSAASFRLI